VELAQKSRAAVEKSVKWSFFEKPAGRAPAFCFGEQWNFGAKTKA